MKIRHVLVSVVEAVGEGTFVYNMTKKGISWESDKELIKKTQYKPWEVAIKSSSS
jgi:hypothetical protein